MGDSDDDKPTHKCLTGNSHRSCLQSSTAPPHRDVDKVSMPDEERLNRNLKALQWESDNSAKNGIDDGKDNFKELAQELNKEGLGEPVKQILANILETVWQNPQFHERIKHEIKIYPMLENCSSLVVKKCNKEIWQAHLTSSDRIKDLCLQKIETAVLKDTIVITHATNDLVKLKNNEGNCQSSCHQNLY